MPSVALDLLREQHRSHDTGERVQVLDMTHTKWFCSCGQTFIGSGALGEHKRVALREIRLRLRKQTAEIQRRIKEQRNVT